MSELKKNRNAGFSLVEVVIAMAIFTICLVPLLRSFVVVSNTNAKARQTLNASTMAENEIEQIKSVGVTSYVAGDTPTGYVTIDGVDYPCYQVSYTNRSFDNKTYQMNIVLTPSTETYMDSTGTEQKLNSQTTAELYTMSNKTDAFYVEETNVLNSIALDYIQAHPSETLNNVKSNIKTEYTFVISNTGGVQSVEQRISRTYPNNMAAPSETASIFSSLQTGNELKSLYIFYVPSGSSGNETFIIENPDNYPLDVYIVQQKAHSYDPIKKAAALTVVETGSTSTNAPTTIRTNMAVSDFNNIYYQYSGLTKTPLSDINAKSAFGFHELGVDEDMSGQNARLYDITATVCDANGNQLISLTGTALR